jgi:hypothetical protein
VTGSVLGSRQKHAAPANAGRIRGQLVTPDRPIKCHELPPPCGARLRAGVEEAVPGGNRCVLSHSATRSIGPSVWAGGYVGSWAERFQTAHRRTKPAIPEWSPAEAPPSNRSRSLPPMAGPPFFRPGTASSPTNGTFGRWRPTPGRNRALSLAPEPPLLFSVCSTARGKGAATGCGVNS